ncbi:MAG: ABC transporter ATP-binding protein/permease [Desulfovibrio sp.]|nr:ABC transporter ATP-binding protein/permease [Desulfovibrio sp.]
MKTQTLFRSLFDRGFADFLRVYRVLPLWLQRSTLRIFACVALQALLEVGSILAISFLAVSIVSPERLLAVPAVETLFRFLPLPDAARADPRVFSVLAAAFTVAVIGAKNGMTAYVSLATARLGERISLFAGETIFRNFLYSPYILHLSGDSQLMFQAISWRGDLGRMIILLMSFYTYMAISAAMALLLLFFTPVAVLLIITALGAIAAAVYRTLKGSIDRAGASSAQWSASENRTTMNAMSGIRETLIYRQQEVFFQRFRQSCRDGMEDRAFLSLAPPVPTWILETAGFLMILAIQGIMYALLDASATRVTAVLTIVMLISWRVLPLLNRSLGALVSVRGARHTALNCLTRVEDALDNPFPPPPEPDPDFAFRGNIALRGVSFRYPKAEEDCLKDITFAIPYGARVGIVGQSGSGKSTAAAILSGLVEPDRGLMLIDGRTLSPAQIVAYRQSVGYVPQNPYILAGTVAENVAFSQWGKPWDEEKVLAACRLAELDVAFRRGIDFPLGQGGAGLSGGQAQRLSIARALYADPSILILDEATSALDSGVEKAVMDTILALPQNITTITIAHRLTTVERCDSLIWLEEGRVLMLGPPAEVLPKYQDFLEQRARERGMAAAGEQREKALAPP